MRWKRWKLNRTIIKWMTCGKMKALRELAVSIKYEDWVCTLPSFSTLYMLSCNSIYPVRIC